MNEQVAPPCVSHGRSPADVPADGVEPSPRFLARYHLGPGVDAAVLGVSAGATEVAVSLTRGRMRAPIVHWGLVAGDGQWRVPPARLWPEATSLYREDERGRGAVRTPMSPCADGVFSATLRAPAQEEGIAFALFDAQAGYDNNGGKNYSVPSGRTRSVESVDARYALRVEQVAYYPPVFDFLLCSFPHTVTLRLSARLPAPLAGQVRGAIAFETESARGTVAMLPDVDGEALLLEGTLRPSSPGVCRYAVVVGIGDQEFVVERGAWRILAPRPRERWTQGPLAVRIDRGLYLGNACAAADPGFLEETMRDEEGSRHQIAVLNAAGEREPRPALLGPGTTRTTSFVYRKFPFTDFSHNPMPKDAVWRAVLWISEQLARGPLLIHCHAGIGRSSSLLVAYLRLVRSPGRTYDEVVEQVKARARAAGHDIFPHVGLPEVLAEIQEDAACGRALAELLGVERYDFAREPTGEVHAVSFTGRAVAGHAWTVREGETIVVRAAVGYTGAEPRGVFVRTDLEGDECERLMDRVAEGVYEGEVRAVGGVGAFWLTVSASTRRHDHPVRRRWAGVDAALRVE